MHVATLAEERPLCRRLTVAEVRWATAPVTAVRTVGLR